MTTDEALTHAKSWGSWGIVHHERSIRVPAIVLAEEVLRLRAALDESSSLDDAIEWAAREMPEGYEILIRVENGSADVVLHDQFDGNRLATTQDRWDGEPSLSDRVRATAIDAREDREKRGDTA